MKRILKSAERKKCKCEVCGQEVEIIKQTNVYYEGIEYEKGARFIFNIFSKYCPRKCEYCSYIICPILKSRKIGGK